MHKTTFKQKIVEKMKNIIWKIKNGLHIKERKNSEKRKWKIKVSIIEKTNEKENIKETNKKNWRNEKITLQVENVIKTL